MIVARLEGGVAALEVDLPEGSIAYVDRDWIPAGGEGPVPSLVVLADGRLRSTDGTSFRVPAGGSPDVLAAAALEHVALRAVEAALRSTAGPVHVVGEGMIAEAVRNRLADRLWSGDPAGPWPDAAIDTSGDERAILEATRKLPDLGTLVLAGELAETSLTIDLYPDIHGRGLRLLAVAPPCSNGSGGDGELPDLYQQGLAQVRGGGALGDARWFRVDAPDPR